MATAESSHDEPVPSAEEPNNKPEWLIDIVKEQQELLTVKTEKQVDEKPTRPMTRIQKVNKTLVRESNKACFDPLVVSFGPFHHGKEGLMGMEPRKNVAAAWFISVATGKTGERANTITPKETIDVYQKFKKAVTFSPRDCYADHEFFHKPKFPTESEDLMPMMFLDGCFILHFIHLLVKGSSDDLWKSSHDLNQPHIVRDMFLLENQIPYPILSALMSILPDKEIPKAWIMEFIFTFFLPPFEFNFSVVGCWRVLFLIFENFISPIREYHLLGIWEGLYDKGSEPVHLLDLLQAVLVGGGASPNSSHGSGYWNYYFRPITELKATGIHVSRGNFWMLKDVKFKRHPINSHLVLPQLVVDDSTETRLLNLLAYEKCSDGPLNRTVTSYVCFLDTLIHNTEDVKELQCKKILLNRLGSNEKVDELFKNLATNLSPDYNVYIDVINVRLSASRLQRLRASRDQCHDLSLAEDLRSRKQLTLEGHLVKSYKAPSNLVK
ncbi:UPF0481-like protein [Cinnamomum micranthum f. kanehirae]|uniref:UPF0481-like protein n=1 Tax=Cinnamomum micranthum f. kanehirae TaxID=337451 RepID=A0A443N867_9MAGN|nr:UPF0481-like protein [Cinnamomum micranthum f. kanehirae]